MDAVENLLHGVFGTLSTWLPGGSAGGGVESPMMSREFWMPDQSCRVCYECESQFTLFNRKHHCRICGRVFCGKCTLNTIPASSSGVLPEAHRYDDGERVRVCNFCFKLRQQVEKGGEQQQVSTSPTSLSPSSSRSSLFSTSNTTSMASPHASSRWNDGGDYKQKLMTDLKEDINFSDDGKHLPVTISMSDDEEEAREDQQISVDAKDQDDEYGIDMDTQTAKHRSQSSIYSSHSSESMHFEESRPGSERSSFRRSSDDIEGLDDYNFHNHLYEAAYGDVDQTVDFENNMLVWFPPPPEDEDDENGPGYDDEDDDDEGGGWGLPRSSGSMSSSEYRSRERAASEEHRKAMRAVVDGHFRALVAQLLRGENIPVEDEDDKDSWLEIVTSLALQAASVVKPDSSREGSMDPGGYVKVKCIASGCRSDSMIIKGIVCKKNLAHKRMITRFKNPRLLLIGGALEYQRVSNTLSSIDTLLQQERDYLMMATSRIEHCHPNVVLVEKAVARFAQERLAAKEISLVQNVKRPLLERIARCTGADILQFPSASLPKTGHCELFHTEKFVEEHGSAGQGGKQGSKTLMFFEGCPKPLGCTALLRGANGDELKKIKRVLQLAVFASYHLALETSFLADEGASLPDHRSPIVVTLPSKHSSSDRNITPIPGFSIPSSENHTRIVHYVPRDGEIRPEGGPLRNFSFTSMNGFNKDWQSSLSELTVQGISGLSASLRSAFGEEAMREGNMWNFYADKPPKEENMPSAQNEAESVDADEQGNKDDFPPTPSDHQSILVSLSTRCLTKGSVCERPNIVRIKYYGNSDKPLGRFLRDTLFDLNNRCPHCEEPPDAHVRCYTHRLGSLTISVRRMDDHILPGESEGKIWMWHRCLKCPRANDIPPVTRRIVMSDAAWGLSFGKFLELSFSNHAAASRVAVCGHQLHRDCLRFYGFGNVIACFRYAAVHLHSVHLPPPKLEFNGVSQQNWLKNEAEEVASKGEIVFTEILNTLFVIGEHIAKSGSFSGSGKIAEAKRRAVYLEALFQKEKAEFEAALLKAAPEHTEPGQPVADILELNRLRKELVVRASEWEKRLHFFLACSQRKLSASSDPGLLLDQNLNPTSTKDVASSKQNILKTYSNTDVGGIMQPFSPDFVGNNGEKPEKVWKDGEKPEKVWKDGEKPEKVWKDGEKPEKVWKDGEKPEKVWKDGEKPEKTGKDGLKAEKPGKDGEKAEKPGKDEEKTDISCKDREKMEKVGKDRENVDTESDSATACKVTVTCLPLEESLESIDGEIRRTLSEGHCPVLPDLSHSLEAAWSGETGTSAAAVDEHNDTRSSEETTESENKRIQQAVTDLKLEDIPSGEALDEMLTQQKELDELGNWIDGPYSTLYRARGLSSTSPTSTSLINCKAAQKAVEGGARLFLPPGVNGIIIAVYEDEPTSIIAHALVSQPHIEMLGEKKQADKADKDNGSASMSEETASHISQSDDAALKERANSFKETSSSGVKDDPLLNTKGVNLKIENSEAGPDAKLRYVVTAYYAKHFDALRKKCCSGDLDYIRSLSRCKKWGAQGGKSNVFFAKTMDDRFIVKQVTRTELLSFLEFAPEYFRYLSESLNTGPTCLAKILGMYQVIIKQARGGKEVRMDLMVMENLLYGRHHNRLYDLKGSVRSRYNSDSTGKNTVLLDQNLLESMPTAPIFVGNKAKRLLERAVWNDTAFLANIDVMDYSLLVGIDEERGELVLGIIDFMRQYTWDKHLETWVKASGILGGPKNAAPTVISPKQYKKRFRKAMSTYFVTVPDHWIPPSVISAHPAANESSSNLQDDYADSFTV